MEIALGDAVIRVRGLGVQQNTAWLMKQKLAQVMLEREDKKPLDGRVEMDDFYLGGERHGGKRGRGSPSKTSFVAAVETNDNGNPVRVKTLWSGSS
jgi:ISXO2-like transposase domain